MPWKFDHRGDPVRAQCAFCGEYHDVTGMYRLKGLPGRRMCGTCAGMARESTADFLFHPTNGELQPPIGFPMFRS